MVSLPGHPAPVFPPNGEAAGAAVLCTGRKYNYSYSPLLQAHKGYCTERKTVGKILEQLHPCKMLSGVCKRTGRLIKLTNNS